VYAQKTEFSPLGYLFLGSDKVLNLMKETISDSYNAVGDVDIEETIQRLCEEHPQLFMMQTKPRSSANQQLDFMDMEAKPPLNNRTFSRSIPVEPGYQVSSFSSLTSWMEEDPDMPDYDQFLIESDLPEPDASDGEPTIFNFPRGPQPGTCIHKIFEEIDFNDLSEVDEVITTELSRYGIDGRWKPVVKDMLKTVTEVGIHPENEKLKLSAVQRKDIVPELEFYYQTGDITSDKLLSIIRDNYDAKVSNTGRATSGFLKGYIDLTFQFGGKFYLLDYKTNHLGNSVSDYQQEMLDEEMREASYDLQYHIYSIALHRFLKKRLSGYSYEEHFGGAFYLFLRGMNQDGREGIYFDRPDYSTIQELDKYISLGGQYE
jgi:exodeoxyribonuclease V beta subunit